VQGTSKVTNAPGATGGWSRGGRKPNVTGALIFFGCAFVLLFTQISHIERSASKRKELIQLRDQGVSTDGKYSNQQGPKALNPSGRTVRLGNTRVTFVANGVERDVELSSAAQEADRQRVAGDTLHYHVRYLPSDPSIAFCWPTSDILGVIDREISSSMWLIIFLSAVIALPAVIGLWLLLVGEK
jgi:hypothetical protein